MSSEGDPRLQRAAAVTRSGHPAFPTPGLRTAAARFSHPVIEYMHNLPEAILVEHAFNPTGKAEDRPWMDLDRVGIMGASRGSLQTLRAMAQAPGIHTVGVTVSTVVGTGYSWDTTPSGVIPMLGNLVGPLLMIQGTEDGGMIDVLRLSEEFRPLGTQHRVVLLPGAGHIPQEEDRRFMNATIRDFFSRTLRE